MNGETEVKDSKMPWATCDALAGSGVFSFGGGVGALGAAAAAEVEVLGADSAAAAIVDGLTCEALLEQSAGGTSVS